jgi:hypothetical protein
VLWAGGVGALAFFLTHLSHPFPSWQYLIAGALGIGGAAGLLAWLFGNLVLVNAVAVFWLFKHLRRRPGWNGAA